MNSLRDFKPKIKLFLIVTSIAVVVSVAGILLLKAMMPAPQPSASPQLLDTSDPSLSPSTPLGINSVEGWQTYRNGELDFEVMYPGNWKFVEFVRPSKFSIAFMVKEDEFLAAPSALEITNMNTTGVYNTAPKSTSFQSDTPHIIFVAGRQVYASCYESDRRILKVCNQILATFRFIQ